MATFDKQKTEREALHYLSKGAFDRAQEAYAKLLRHDPRDRRVRQKLAELYLKTGRKADAEKQFREVAKLHASDGNFRAEVAVLKQLQRLIPQDAEVMGMLAGAHHATGLDKEAVRLYEQAINLLAQREPGKAADLCRDLLKIQTGDVVLAIKRAELLARTKKRKGEAYEAYRAVMDDLRRKGRADEVGRVAAMALDLKPDDASLRLDAAEAALGQGDIKAALAHVQVAREEAPGDPRALRLAADALERTDDPKRARPVLVKLGVALGRAGDHAGRLAALERAALHGQDTSLTQALDKARSALELANFRLWELGAAEPGSEAILRVAVRAQVLLEYGLGERARPEIEAARAAAPDEPAYLAVAAECLAAEGDAAGALGLARQLQDLCSGNDARRLTLRLAVLEGEDPASLLGEDVEDEPTSDELLDDEDTGDEFTDDGSVDDLVDDDDDLIDDDDDLLDDDSVAPQDDGLVDDDLDDDDDFLKEPEPTVPVKQRSGKLFDDIFGDGEGGVDMGATFAEVDPDSFRHPSGKADVARLEALAALGAFAELEDAARALDGLWREAWRAVAAADDDLRNAFRDLRDEVDDAPPGAAGLGEALYVLILLAARRGKHRVASRYLERLQKDMPEHRSQQVGELAEALSGLTS